MIDFSPSLIKRAEALLAAARTRNIRIATAESCTGGLVAALLTNIAGSSDVFERGFVTYSNEAKTEMLGVPAALIAAHGAVSLEVASAMAEGALARAHATLSVSITGVAGPGGGTRAKPVGMVCFGAARQDGARDRQEHQFGDLGRAKIREKGLKTALSMLEAMIEDAHASSSNSMNA